MDDCGVGTDPLAEFEEFRWRRFAAASLVALALAGLSVETLLGSDLRPREPRIIAVRAKADAFVSGANKASNFGARLDLRIDASPTFRAFMRFKARLSDDVERVHLLLYSRTQSRAGYQVRLVEEPWRERKITFLNAPSLSPDFVLSGPLRARAWKSVDITSLIEQLSGDEAYISLALTTKSLNAVELASRESGMRGPRLVVERKRIGDGDGPATTDNDDSSY
jgi:hypothetical protein